MKKKKKIFVLYLTSESLANCEETNKGKWKKFDQDPVNFPQLLHDSIAFYLAIYNSFNAIIRFMISWVTDGKSAVFLWPLFSAIFSPSMRYVEEHCSILVRSRPLEPMPNVPGSPFCSPSFSRPSELMEFCLRIYRRCSGSSVHSNDSRILVQSSYKFVLYVCTCTVYV